MSYDIFLPRRTLEGFVFRSTPLREGSGAVLTVSYMRAIDFRCFANLLERHGLRRMQGRQPRGGFRDRRKRQNRAAIRAHLCAATRSG